MPGGSQTRRPRFKAKHVHTMPLGQSPSHMEPCWGKRKKSATRNKVNSVNAVLRIGVRRVSQTAVSFEVSKPTGIAT